jgi:hypothetical protein
MIRAEDVHRYRIDGCYDLITRIDGLYSETEHDPDLIARLTADEQGWLKDSSGKDLPYDVVPAICPEGKLIVQVIVFRDYDGYTRYLADGITIFDDREA